jgi:hypothetical protein
VEHSTYVTASLATGLARQAIRDWHDRVKQCEARLTSLRRRHFTTPKGAARVSRDVQNLLGPIAFDTGFTEFKRKGVLHGAILPKLRVIDGVEYLAIEAQLFAVDLEGFRRGSSRLLVCIHPHALARMFLRMQATEFVNVREQLKSCLYLYPALADACLALKLRQIVIPTKQGHFRCDVRMDVGEPAALLAKTWLVTGPTTLRDLDVLFPISTALTEWSERASGAERADMSSSITAPASLVQGIVEKLRVHTWLTEPYMERPDPLSEMWEAARRRKESDADEPVPPTE